MDLQQLCRASPRRIRDVSSSVLGIELQFAATRSGWAQSVHQSAAVGTTSFYIVMLRR